MGHVLSYWRSNISNGGEIGPVAGFQAHLVPAVRLKFRLSEK